MNENNEKLKSLYEELFQIEVLGTTVEVAIETALKQSGLNKDEVSIKVLSEGSPGLFGLSGDKPAKILFAPKYERKDLWLKFFVTKLINLIFSEQEQSFVEVEIKNNLVHLTIDVKEEVYTKLLKTDKNDLYDSIVLVLEILLKRIDDKLNLVLDIRKF